MRSRVEEFSRFQDAEGDLGGLAHPGTAADQAWLALHTALPDSCWRGWRPANAAAWRALSNRVVLQSAGCILC